MGATRRTGTTREEIAMANEPSSDYGYDLVHGDLGHGDLVHGDLAPEAAPVSRSPGARLADRAGREPGRPPVTGSTGDHGYDEAHDF